MLGAVRERKLIAAVAGCAVLFVALLMLGPGRERPVLASRIFGGAMSEGARQTSFRLVLVLREGGFEEKVGGRELHLLLTRVDGSQATWEGVTARDGTAEVTVTWEEASSGPIHLHVKDTEGQVLLEGDLPERPASWAPSEPRDAELRGHETGELGIRAALSRGVSAAPFPEEVVVEVRHDGIPVEKAHVKVSASGAVLHAGEGDEGESPGVRHVTIRTDHLGQARLRLQPMSHDTELAVEASLDELSGAFAARLPVVPGAIWLEPPSIDATALTLVSPVPRDVAYVSVATPRARLFGATVPLEEDGRGYAVGSLDLRPALATIRAESSVHLTVASSLGFDGAGTIAWPLSPAGDPFAAKSMTIRDVLLLDGMPERLAAEKERRRKSAWLAALVLTLAASIETWLLVRAARGPSLAMAAEGVEDSLKLPPAHFGSYRLLVAIVLTALAFAAVGIVALLRS